MPQIPTLIGLHGYPRSGKDTLAKCLAEFNYQRFAFADELRATLLRVDPALSGPRLSEIVSEKGWDHAESSAFGPKIRAMRDSMKQVAIHLGTPDADTRACLLALDPAMEGASLKNLIHDIGWEEAKDYPVHGDEVRGLMQRWGSEVGRAQIGTNVWVDIVERSIAESTCEFAVITDVRFPQEAAWVRSQGVLWQITRPGFGAVNAHSSEKPLDPSLIDRQIDNDGTYEDLVTTCRCAMGAVGLPV